MERNLELPEDIIQHILSFLATEETARPSFVSKTWLSASSKLPDLVLHHSFFRREFYRRLDYDVEFLKFVDNTLRRHCEQKDVCIDKLRLNLPLSINLLSYLENWLELLAAKNVKHLAIVLYFPKVPESILRTMPQSILASNSLVELVLDGTYSDFNFKQDHQQVSKKCYSLKRLCIERFRVEESAITSLCSIFPCIEDLTLDDCLGLSKFDLSGLLNLKKLDVTAAEYHHPTVKISVAQSLESLSFLSRSCIGEPRHFDISCSRGLKHISLERSNIIDTSLSSLISQCPLLEDLELTCCIELERMNVSSPTLKYLRIENIFKLQEVKIDAPNLIRLYYEGCTVPCVSLIKPSKDLKSFVHIDRSHDIRTSFFVKFRKLLTLLSPSRAILTIESKKIRANIEELRKVEELDPKPKLENLELRIYSHSLTLLDGLWWCCCPANVTVPWNRGSRGSIKFLCKELMDRGCSRQCCNANRIMCWRHYLNHVEAEYFHENYNSYYLKEIDDADKPILYQHLDWKSLADGSLYRKEQFEIRFSLDWHKSF